jgi:hypothetical protein
MTDQTHDPTVEEVSDTLYCEVHPSRETNLRCNRCGRAMCAQCAVRTPVGYRCKECVREQQGVYYNAGSADYVIAGVVSLVLGALGSYVVGLFGFFLFAIFIAPVAGTIIGDAVHRAVGRRRGRYTWLVVAVGIVVGSIVPRLIPVLAILPALAASSGALPPEAGAPSPLTYLLAPFANPALWIYLVLAPGAAIGRLRFGRIRFG